MAIFDEKIEIRERCKGVYCVDLGESFPTRIYLQKSESIQTRTSPSKFWGKQSILFTGVLSEEIAELCKGVYCVDLGESFQTHIFLQIFASIQPRTSPVKFDRSSRAGCSSRHLVSSVGWVGCEEDARLPEARLSLVRVRPHLGSMNGRPAHPLDILPAE